MKALFNNTLAPLTFSVGFLEAPFASVIDANFQWIQPLYKTVEMVHSASDLRNALCQLVPLSAPPRRELLFATESNWTAYFDNGRNGPDAFPPISYLAQKLGCRGLVATCVPHTLETETGMARGTYGAVQFEMFGPVQREFLNYERSISVAYEAGKWRFDVIGMVQPFEEVAKYSARKIFDRFTPDMLERYCESLGVRLFDETFYSGPGELIAIRDTLPSNCVELTLEEARLEMGFG
jgi:hypothetical protein